MDKVLLVEDSSFFAEPLKERIEAEFNCQVCWTQTLQETEELLKAEGSDFFVSVLDYTLPDASDGEILDCVLSYDIPSIVFSGVFSDDARDHIWSKSVLDYVIKGGPESIDYVISLMKHLAHAKETKVLVVDDSRVFRTQATDLLKIRQYNIFEAASGDEALEILAENPDIQMVIVDYYMPGMSGIELTGEIRRKFGRDEVAIIGVSTEGGGIISAQFIKNGANDFLNKPFLTEEFYCRITQNIDLLRYIAKAKELSSNDFLTNLYNRRCFFEFSQKIYASAKRKSASIAVAMLDIDRFKKINDAHGHHAGDEVLISIAETLRKSFRETDIVARFGGDEFCVMAPNLSRTDMVRLLERIRQAVEDSEITVGEKKLKVTVSIGACTELLESLEEMIKKADKMLYAAKEQGRNLVLVS